jgi:hypothetical protein
MALVQMARSDRLCLRRNWLRVGNGQADKREAAVRGRQFDRDVIILCVRWYLRFKLSLRDLVEMMAERGLSMAHTTIMQPQRTRLPPMASVRLMLRKLCQHTL